MADGETLADEETFEVVGDGPTYSTSCYSLQKGGYVMIRGCPCKIVELSMTQTGKQGNAKIHIVASDIFTGKTLEEICPAAEKIDIPNIPGLSARQRELLRDEENLEVYGDGPTYSTSCYSLQKGGYVMIRGCPCKIVELRTAQTGKHGNYKFVIIAFDIFTGETLEEIRPGAENIDIPNITRKKYQLVGMLDNCLMLRENTWRPGDEEKRDIPLPANDLGEEIKSKMDHENLEITIQAVLRKETVLETVFAVKTLG